MADTKVGWIGIGVMGRSMCGHLLKAGYPVSLFTRTREKAAELLAGGAPGARLRARWRGEATSSSPWWDSRRTWSRSTWPRTESLPACARGASSAT